MKGGVLSYNGTTYRLSAAEVEDLLGRGVIVADSIAPDAFELAREHTIDEIGAEARGEGGDLVRQKMLAVRYMHRDGQGGAH
jgi:hypothetical protein